MNDTPAPSARTAPLARLAALPWPDLVLVTLLLVAFLVMGRLSPAFFTGENLLEVTRFSAEVGFIALGMTLVILTGGIDLSVGSVLGLSGVVFGLLTNDGVPVVAAAALALLAGATAGLVNGLVIAYIGIPPLIVTLATLAIYRGLALGLSQARAFDRFPDGFLALGQGYVGGVPVQLLLLLAVAALLVFVLARSALGRMVYALGHNATAARFAGLPTQTVLVIVYTLSGLLAALAGIVYTARLTSARADAGTGFELDAITAVVLGGTAITGGTGGVIGTLLGLLLVGVIRNGLTLAFVPTEQQDIIVGACLLVAVLLNQFFRARRAPART